MRMSESDPGLDILLLKSVILAGAAMSSALYSSGHLLWAYLRDVLERIPTHPNRRREKLLPRQWKAVQTATPS